MRGAMIIIVLAYVYLYPLIVGNEEETLARLSRIHSIYALCNVLRTP